MWSSDLRKRTGSAHYALVPMPTLSTRGHHRLVLKATCSEASAHDHIERFPPLPAVSSGEERTMPCGAIEPNGWPVHRRGDLVGLDSQRGGYCRRGRSGSRSSRQGRAHCSDGVFVLPRGGGRSTISPASGSIHSELQRNRESSRNESEGATPLYRHDSLGQKDSTGEDAGSHADEG